MATERPPDQSALREESREAKFDRLFAGYIDRLNLGETLDKTRILAEHPDLGPELLTELETFQQIGAGGIKGGELGRMGDFRLLRQIGKGGMGIVYEAEQASMDRRVALKVLRAGMPADQKSILRFLREAKVAGKLQHPHIVPVHQMGVEGGTPFFVMEFVEGETLDEILRRLRHHGGPDSSPAAAQALSKVSQSMDWRPGDDGASPRSEPLGELARDRPISHTGEGGGTLDTDGINLAYCMRIATAFAGVADGLQHAHGRGVVHRDLKPSNLILDRAGRVRILDFGLARLEGQKSLTVSGEFLGTPLYMSPEQAMAHRAPVDSRTDIYSLGATLYEMLTWRPPFHGRDYKETLSLIISRDPLPPRSCNVRIPRDLETIVLKCLRKDPAERYGTAEALGQDLHRFVRGDPIEARPQPAWERLARRAWRNKVKLAMAAVVSTMSLGLLALALVLNARFREDRRMNYERLVNESIAQLELGVLTSSGESREGETVSLGLIYRGDVERRSGDHWRDVIERAAERLREAVTLRPERPEAYVHLGRAVEALGRTDEALARFREARALEPRHVPAALLEAQLLADSGRIADADGLRQEAARGISREWEAWWIAAHKAAIQGDWAGAQQIYQRSLRGLKVEPFVGYETELRLQLGRAAVKRKEYWTAVEEFVALKQAWPRQVGPGLLLASVYYLMGEKAAAQRTIDEVLSIESPVEEVVAAADVHFHFGELERARETISRIKDAGRRQLALARLLMGASNREEALATAREAFQLGNDSAEAYSVLGGALRDSNRVQEALTILLQGIARFPDDARLVLTLADIQALRGDVGAAIRLYESVAPRSPEEAQQGIGWGYFDLCDFERSVEAFTRAIEAYPRHWSAYWGRGIVRVYAEDWEHAFDDIVQSLILKPDLAWRAVYLYAHSPSKRRFFAPHWDHMSEVLEEAALRGIDTPKHLGLLAVSNVRRSRPDLPKALEQARGAVSKTGNANGVALSALAQVQFARGEVREAIQSLERALEVLERLGSAKELLDEYRAGVFPRLLTCASIDEFLERSDRGSREFDRDLAAVRAAMAEDPARARYLAARIEEIQGRGDRALEEIQALVAGGELMEEAAILRLADLLSGLGRREEAISAVEDHLLAPGLGTLTAWGAWIHLLSQEPPAPTEQIFQRRPLTGEMSCRPFAEDVRWALRELATSGILRIRCGVLADSIDGRGRPWSGERFIDGGQVRASALIRDTDEPDLYANCRWWYWPGFFVAPGFRIPVPDGRYEVTLHCVRPTVFPERPEKRTADVLAEGQVVLSRYVEGETGLGVPEPKTFLVDVQDGILDIVFRVEWRFYVSAIEVKRLSG
jgi:serine/threonine protein kinase/tetratricopeptide (TPR) repeat protein